MERKNKAVNEKIFTWNDVRFSTVYSMLVKAPYTALDHNHSQYEMFVFKEAKGEMRIGGKTIRLGRNMAVIVPPRTIHSVNIEAGCKVLGMIVSFVYRSVTGVPGLGADKVYDVLDACIPKSGTPSILKGKYFGYFCSAFAEETESSPLIASALIRHLLEGLFIQVIRSTLGSTEKDMSIFSYTSRGLSNDLVVAIEIDNYMYMPGCTLIGLSEKIKMSPRNIQRIIKNIYGKSFSERLAEIRITRAISLMSNSELSLAEISAMAHYNRYDSFRKAFIARLGVSPTEYRASHFGIDDNETAKWKENEL